MKKLVFLLTSLALFAAACNGNTTVDTAGSGDDAQATVVPDGGSGDDAEATAEPDPQETVAAPTTAPATTPTTAAPTPTATPDDSETADATSSGAATPVPTRTSAARAPAEPLASQAQAVQAVLDADDWCGAAQAVEDGTLVLEQLDFTSPVAVEQGLTQAVAVVSAAKPLAPPEIAADVDDSIELFTTLATELEEVDWNFLALGPELILEFDGANELATYNIEKYNFDNCGIGTDPGEPPVLDGTDRIPDPLSPSGIPPIVLEGPALEQAVVGLTAAGFTEEEARCILQTLDLTNPEAFTNTTAILKVFTDCGISLDRLAQLGG